MRTTGDPRPTSPRYLGRFAPSPSGPLHLGSLYTALASFLDARSVGGEWIVRIDDIDPERSRPSAVGAILRTLERHGLHWDREPTFQSGRAERYAEALAGLQAASLLYPCVCSRKELAVGGADAPYPGHCRRLNSAELSGSYAWRLQARDTTVSFVDLLQGRYAQDLAKDVGDFVVRRRNGAFAYHLATVLDDHDAGVTHVVRGVDLLASTPRQIYLQQLLGLRRPQYGHLPVLLGADGKKLSKSTDAESANVEDPRSDLFQLLVWLEQRPPRTLALEPVETILKWAIESWRIDRLRGRTDVSIVDSRARDTAQQIETGETSTG